MEDERVGRLVRAVRRKRGWRQVDVAAQAGCSQRWVAEIELGRLEGVTVGTMRRVGDVLEIRTRIDAWRRRGDGARLLDEEHARLVEVAMRALVREGWDVTPEWSFNHFGERGSVDIVAWHHASRTLLLIEIKSRIDDVQELIHTFGRKVRIVPGLVATQHGRLPAHVATMLIVAATRTAERVVRAHAATFDAVWPERSDACRRSIRRPVDVGAAFRGGTGSSQRDPTAHEPRRHALWRRDDGHPVPPRASTLRADALVVPTRVRRADALVVPTRASPNPR